MKIIQSALNAFKHWIMGELIFIPSDSAIVVAYVKKTRLHVVGQSRTLSARCTLGKNILVDQLRQPDQVLHIE